MWKLSVFILLIYACNTPVDFKKDIAPILAKNCSNCHNPSGIAPFSLLNYTHAKIKAKTIAHVVKNKYMPPWPADKNYIHFAGEIGLTNKEINTILMWVNEGCKEGEKLVNPIWKQTEVKEVKPDMILNLPLIKVKNDYIDRFYQVAIAGVVKKGTYLRAVYFVPGKASLVHHFNGHLFMFDEGLKKNIPTNKYVEITENSKPTNWIKDLNLLQDDGSLALRVHSAVNYLPGAFGIKYPPGIGTIPLTTKFCFVGNDMHIGPSENTQVEQSKLYLFFTNVKPTRQINELMLGTNGVAPIVPKLVIKANTTSLHTSSYLINSDISILTINPHMHRIGTKFLAYALKPNGDTIRLIHIPKWYFNWQYFYTFKTMVKIPKGSTIVAKGWFDNTTKNENNPFNPPRTIEERLQFGGSSMRTTDEMFQFIITYTDYKIGDEKVSLESK